MKSDDVPYLMKRKLCVIYPISEVLYLCVVPLFTLLKLFDMGFVLFKCFWWCILRNLLRTISRCSHIPLCDEFNQRVHACSRWKSHKSTWHSKNKNTSL